MKILMPTMGQITTSEGWCRHFLEIANNLSALGHKVVVVYPDVNIQGLSKDCVQIRLPDIRSDWVRWPIYLLAMPLAIIRAAVGHGCEVILYRQWWSSVLTALVGRLCCLRIVPEVNSVLYYEYKQAKDVGFIGRNLRVALNRISESVCYRLASKIIVVSDVERDHLMNHYAVPPDKINIVCNGANEEVSHPMDKLSCREKLGLDKGSPVIVFVGTFYRWQGLDTLVRSIAIIRRTFPDVKVLLVGDGEVLEEIDQMVKSLQLGENVIFVGRVDYSKVPEYIGAADICAGRFEPARYRAVGGSPLKIVEYLACGRPVVCSRTRSYWEYIDTEGLGALVKSEDPNALADAFISLFSDRDELEQMGKRCRDYAEAYLTWRRAAKEVELVCRQALDSRQ
jgi:glycosyltransferase involved in cell wall biosynthesis